MKTRSLLSNEQWRTCIFFLILQALFFLFITSFNLAYGKPDLRHLVFKPVPYPGEESPAGVMDQPPAAEDFLSFEKYLPVSRLDMINDGVQTSAATVDVQQKLVEQSIMDKGPYSAEIEEGLFTLGTLYQNSGQHEKALEAFSHAMQINKISNGLFHEDQIPLVESSIQSFVALGQYGKVNEQLEYLIYLHQKYYGNDSREIIKPLASKVAWDMYFYEHRALPGSIAGLDRGQLVNGFSQLPQNSPVSLLSQTQEMIIRAIQILVRDNDFGNPFLHQFEQQLIETYFYQASFDAQNRLPNNFIAGPDGSFYSSDPFDVTKANYLNGEKAYGRLLKYLEKSGQQDSLEYVLATIGLGDWYLLFSKLDKSRQQYALANTLLQNGAFSDKDRQYLLQPAVPTELPAFGRTPLFSAVQNEPVGTGDFVGYVDVAFRVSRFGKAVDFETLGYSPGTPGYIQSELEWKVRKSRFRPQLAGDKDVPAAPTRFRYYYAY